MAKPKTFEFKGIKYRADVLKGVSLELQDPKRTDNDIFRKEVPLNGARGKYNLPNYYFDIYIFDKLHRVFLFDLMNISPSAWGPWERETWDEARNKLEATHKTFLEIL